MMQDTVRKLSATIPVLARLVSVGLMGFLGGQHAGDRRRDVDDGAEPGSELADSGALAGATALVYNDWDDRSPLGPAS